MIKNKQRYTTMSDLLVVKAKVKEFAKECFDVVGDTVEGVGIYPGQ